MTDNRNTILAVILSGLVLIAWQYFYNVPQMEKQRAQQAQSELAKPAPQPGSTTTPAATPQTAAAPRIKIDTPRVTGSISLKGARIDDLSLVQFRETVDPASPPIVLYSPSGTEEPYYAEFGWVAASGSSAKMPDQSTIWQQEGTGSLTPNHPVTLKYESG